MIYIIVFIVGVILIKFLNDTSKEKNKILSEGGIRIKYRTLIALLMNGDSRTKIYHQDELSVKLGLIVTGASSIFTLNQNYGELLVEYTFKSNMFDDYKLTWHFNEKANQDKTYEKICLDIAKKNRQIGLN